MKNLTPRENIQKIIYNSFEYQRLSFNNADILNDYFRQLTTLLEDVVSEVGNQTNNRLIHLYGLDLPAGIISSDYGDTTTLVYTVDEVFYSLESIKNFFVEKLLEDNELYLYTVSKVLINNLMHIEPDVRYVVRHAVFPRSNWVDLIRNQEQHNREIQELNQLIINRPQNNVERYVDSFIRSEVKKFKF